MGTFSCPIEIISADARSETVDALVDTGSTYTCVPAILLHELGEYVKSELADGSWDRPHARTSSPPNIPSASG